eukprot:m.285948 g.285948  ORF g.285948 m.285948 type:complete len:1583 (+) comp19435_c1_seq19:182-4930(+)
MAATESSVSPPPTRLDATALDASSTDALPTSSPVSPASNPKTSRAVSSGSKKPARTQKPPPPPGPPPDVAKGKGLAGDDKDQKPPPPGGPPPDSTTKANELLAAGKTALSAGEPTPQPVTAARSKRKRKPSAAVVAAAADNQPTTKTKTSGPVCLHCKHAIGPKDGYVTCVKCGANCHISEATIVDKLPWNCPKCIEQCAVCRSPGVLIPCSECQAPYHRGCTYPPLVDVATWRCGSCLVEPLPGKVEKILDWRFGTLTAPPGNAALAPSTRRHEDAVESPSGTKSDLAAADADASVPGASDQASSHRADAEQEPDQTYLPDQPAKTDVASAPAAPQGTGSSHLGNQTNKLSKADAPSAAGVQRESRIRWMHCKWRERSYLHCSWLPEYQLASHHPVLLRHFLKRFELPVRFNAQDSEEVTDELAEIVEPGWKNGVKETWLQPERAIARRKRSEADEYLIKWYDLPYCDCTWELYGDIPDVDRIVAEYQQREDACGVSCTEQDRDLSRITQYKEQPEFIMRQGGSLHPYQVEGLNWLRFSFSKGINTILADEMGLGKTVQTIAFVLSLFEENIRRGPFLVAVPLSTLSNWKREFSRWAPNMNAITYTGNAASRQIIRAHEFYSAQQEPGRKRSLRTATKFNVLLTSFETVLSDSSALGAIKWQLIVVDEAQRLKNKNSKFFIEMSRIHSDHRLLLTGTPLQNNLDELFHLLNFIEPARFASLEKFQDQVADVSKDEQVERLHKLLGPHLLRRLKADVLEDLPSKSEFIVCVGLSSLQKTLYKFILEKNFEALNKGLSKKSGQVSLLNVMMELKKCCNHPYLFPSCREEADVADRSDGSPDEEDSAANHLIRSSGKLLLLDKMLVKLKARGHRVLIFSQMTRLLDVLEEYVTCRGFGYERIDGSVTGADRQERIDRFNAPDAEQFIFLLSTRAGGLGINLATADTVVIYDSDWNPHNDIQAFSRAHRMGQNNKVMVYRFVTRNTIEERIVELAKKKMMLTHLVVRGGSSKRSLSQRELDDILRFGTAELFAEDDQTGEGDTIVYSDSAIENLLDRTQQGVENKETIANEYLSSFKVASFTLQAANEEEPDAEDEDHTDEATSAEDDHWNKLLADRVQQHQLLEEANMGKGKRVRKTVDYSSSGYGTINMEDSEDEEEDAGNDSKDADFRLDEPVTRKRSRKSDSKQPPLLSTRGGQAQVFGFSARQRAAFLRSILSIGLGPCWFERIHANARLCKKTVSNLRDYTNMFLAHVCEPANDSTRFSSGVPKEGLPRDTILERIGMIHLIHRKVTEYYETPVGLTPTQLLRDDVDSVPLAACEWAQPAPDCGVRFHIAEGRFTNLCDLWAAAEPDDWGRHHDLCLLIGVLKHGYGQWSSIMNDEALGLSAVIARASGSPLHEEGSDVDVDMEDKDADKIVGGDGDDNEATETARPAEHRPDSHRLFVARRFKLLETALTVEDQMLGGTEAGLQMDPNDPSLAFYNSIEEINARAACMPPVAELALTGDAAAGTALLKALRQLDSVMREAKDQLTLLPHNSAGRQAVCDVFQLTEARIVGLPEQAVVDTGQAMFLQTQQPAHLIPHYT